MKKHILTAAASLAAAAVLAVSASATTITATGAPTTIAMADEYGNGQSWFHLINIWNDASMYSITDIDAGAKDIIVSFDVSGCDGSYEMLAGFQLNDSCIRDSYGHLKGRYDPKTDTTRDAYGHLVGKGNLLTSLL